MSQITPNIYIGGFTEARNRKWLADRGITHIVNAATELPNYFPNHFKYLRLDLNDVPGQYIHSALNRSYNFMKNVINRGGIVFVHCFAGVSRSSSQIINYIMMDKNVSFEKSLNYMRMKHPRTNPNPGFQRQLVERDPTRRNR